MQTLQLRESEPCRIDFPLTGEQLEVLRQARVEVRPVGGPGSVGKVAWELRPSSCIGVFRCGSLNAVIRPRIPIDRVMFLLGFSLGPSDWSIAPFGMTLDEDILEAIVPAFVRLTQDAIRRGLLQGYREEQDSLAVVRGRIHLARQINRRFGWQLPVEVTHDDFTEDIEENRLLKTAIHLLWRMPIGSAEARRELGALRPAFNSVSLGAYGRGMVPEVRYTRLNLRYRPAVELARLVIGSTLLEFEDGGTTGASLLVDMDQVFEGFVRRALRQELELTEYEWPTDADLGRSLQLEEAGQFRLAPGLTWWRGRQCVFVGDAKYKQADSGSQMTGSQHADIYRMLAFCTAADLSSGLLVYADREVDEALHRIRHSSKTIEVASLDLTGQPQAILDQVRELAARVRAHRDGAVAVA